MLIVSVAINHKVIDLICIHNIGNINNKGLHKYEVLDINTNKRLIPQIIKHKRDSGYRPLLKNVLTLLDKHKIKQIVL